MIDIVAEGELRHLAETADEHCVSVYVPTHRAGREQAEDRIRYKNALTDARTELVDLGLRGPKADALLAPAVALADDDRFWAHVERSVALFASPAIVRALRLAESVDELVVVSDRFHIKPLVPLVATGEVFYVLVLSQSEVRLLRGSRYEVSELALGDIPSSLATALRFDDRESQLHSHGAKRIGIGRVAATFHGHGVGVDTKDADLGRFLSAVDDGLAHIIGPGRAPLVLAGVDSTVARFRQLSRYPHIVSGEIEGNANSLSAAELHDRAWPLAEQVFAESRRRARAAMENGSSPTAETLADVAEAAIDGRVRSVFVAGGVQRWGVFDAAERRIELHAKRHPGDRDLLDAIVVETLTHGGEVFVVGEDEVPRAAPVAAALRY